MLGTTGTLLRAIGTILLFSDAFFDTLGPQAHPPEHKEATQVTQRIHKLHSLTAVRYRVLVGQSKSQTERRQCTGLAAAGLGRPKTGRSILGLMPQIAVKTNVFCEFRQKT